MKFIRRYFIVSRSLRARRAECNQLQTNTMSPDGLAYENASLEPPLLLLIAELRRELKRRSGAGDSLQIKGTFNFQRHAAYSVPVPRHYLCVFCTDAYVCQNVLVILISNL